MVFRFTFYLVSAMVGAALTAGVMLYLQTRADVVNVGRPVADFALLDQDGRFHRLFDYDYAKAIVLYVHGIDCPVVDNDGAMIENLRSQYSPQDVVFLLINANPIDDRKALTNASMRLQSDIPILIDENQLVVEHLGVMRAGEVLVVDPKSWTIRYRGPIDDRTNSNNANAQPSHSYLEDALLAISQDKPVGIANRPGNGCLIDFIKAPASHQKMISYANEIVPILRKRCISCHQQGGIGPWSMDSYASLKAWAPKVREVIMNRTMPPWHADSAVGQFAYDRSLSVKDQRALIHWIDEGAPRGEGSDPLVDAPAKSVEEWPLGEPDLVIKLPPLKIPAEGILAWQFIKVPVPISEDTWVSAVHMKPSNTAATHHVFAFVEYPKQAKDREPNWSNGANGFFAAYVPGVSVQPLPRDSGQFLPKGSVLSFQRHYLTVGYETEDNLQLALYFHEKPPKMEDKMISAVNMGINIPPHASGHNESASATLTEDGELYTLYPHMHYRGKAMRFQAQYPDGSQELLLSVPRYDFNWQTTYQFQQPKMLPAGTKIRVDAEFDNSKQNPANPDPSAAVRWGMLSVDEMLVGYLAYTTRLKETESN